MARIAIDLHGGDFGPSVTLPSSLEFFKAHPHHHGVLVGDSRRCSPFVKSLPANTEWVEAEALGERSQKPSRLLRSSGHSSIEVCFQMLENQVVDTLVSAEHTGVLLTLVTKHSKLHSLLTRPVLASWLPTLAKPTVMLDLGASFSASSDQLLAYAAIGTGLLRHDQAKPSLALLNVGTEFFKGPPELRAADQLLKQWSSIDYRGFVEASQVFHGKLDVIVCDGFTGNSVIKASEGALDLTFGLIRKSLGQSIFGRLAGFWLKRQMTTTLQPLEPRHANGALVAGSNLQVIKSHGNADAKAFGAALERSADICNRQVIPAIWSELNRLIDDDILV